MYIYGMVTITSNSSKSSCESFRNIQINFQHSFKMLKGSFIIMACLLASALGSILDMPKDIKWTSAINEKICLPGNHPDDVSQKFYDCYNPEIVPVGYFSTFLQFCHL